MTIVRRSYNSISSRGTERRRRQDGIRKRGITETNNNESTKKEGRKGEGKKEDEGRHKHKNEERIKKETIHVK